MTPSFIRTHLVLVTRCQRSATSIPLRSFTTTTPRSAVLPENPKFIDIPTLSQAQARPKIIVKGTLPVPREIFRARGVDKFSLDHLETTIKAPSRTTESPDQFVAWKQRLAATRRQNLRQGLKELRARKKIKDQHMASLSKTKQKHRNLLLNAPEREDDRLTKPTVPAAVRALQSGPVPDPGRAERIAASQARVAAKEAAREESRRGALHTLYMNARTFITSEEKLDAEIERIFTQTPFDEGDMNDNIWDKLGAPPTVQDMLQDVNNTQRSAVKYHASPAAATGNRMKKIAEELTGGKMD